MPALWDKADGRVEAMISMSGVGWLFRGANVRLWHKANIARLSPNVRFSG
jgi:hypothetical protein